MRLRRVVLEDLDAAELEAFTEFAEAVRSESFGDAVPFTPEWMLARYYSKSSMFPKQFVLAEKDGQTVGFAHLELDHTGQNDGALIAQIEVHPDHRRAGVATKLLRESLAIGRSANRTRLFPWGRRTDPTVGFWTAMGAVDALSSLSSQLRFADVDQELLATWVANAEPARQRGYQLHQWTGRCPEDLIDQYAAALSGMSDAPLDDLDMEHEAHTPATIRQHEKRWLDVGSQPWAMLITGSDGDAAAMTEVLVHRSRPQEVWQESTTTLEAHRRQGLGRWIKAAMMQWLLTDLEHADTIETGNADSNTSMLAINTEMGFTYRFSFASFQADFADLKVR